MRWTDLPTGPFTGIDWARPDAARGFDPYLVWAEADGFAGYRHAQGGLPRRLPLLIELRPGCTVEQLRRASDPAWLHIPPVYGSADLPTVLRYCTARVQRRFFREIRPGGALHALIERFELGLAARPYTDEPPMGQRPLAPPPAEAKLRGKVLGLIDGGLAFAHADFLHGGQARTRWFWRQDSQGVGGTPAGLGYGHELTGAQIDQAMAHHRHGGLVDESAVYAQFELPDLRRAVNHGTHVMSLAAGPMTATAQLAGVPPHPDAPPSWALADDDASRAPIVAVQLDWSTVLDTSGGSMNVHILDGLAYILSRCEAAARVAVNISWGTLAGPHDGSSVLEAAMDQLIELQRGRLQIVVPAGNSYQSRTHANGSLRRGQSATLNWCVQADDFTQSFVELWLAHPSGRPVGGASVRVTPPGCAPLPWLALGQSAMWTDGGRQPLCALIFPSQVATGTTGTCALLALAPSASFSPAAATAPAGTWRIELRHDTGDEPLVFDAYVERDDVPIGVSAPGGRQSYFTDDLYDTSGNPGSFVDHGDNPTLIRRSGNFNSLSTGRRTVSVGGQRVSNGSWALYSPRKPDPDPSRPQRPGVVIVPDTQAFSDESSALPGIDGAGSRSGAIVRLVGTSSATPQVTRKIFNAL